jgi:hypothetical protein
LKEARAFDNKESEIIWEYWKAHPEEHKERVYGELREVSQLKALVIQAPFEMSFFFFFQFLLQLSNPFLKLFRLTFNFQP